MIIETTRSPITKATTKDVKQNNTDKLRKGTIQATKHKTKGS